MSDLKYFPVQYPKVFEVVVLASQGYDRHEIGDKLSKSPGTVNNQLNFAYRKWGARNKAHLVRLFCEAGLL